MPKNTTPDEWAEIQGEAVTRLRAPKVTPVPASIVKLAQRSYDGIEVDGETRHVMRHTFESAERAEAFAKLMRKAGEHTVPLSSVSVAIDPDRTDDDDEPVSPETVAWRAGNKRGRKAAA